LTTVLTGAATFSMAGLPPLLGFLAKETLFETALTATPDALPSLLIAAAAWIAATLAVGYSLLLFITVFLGPEPPSFAAVHEPGWMMLLPPAVLSALSLFLALPPLRTQMSAVLAAAAGDAYGAPVTVSLALWHGINVPLVMTVAAIVAGMLLYLGRGPVRRFQDGWLARPRLDALYDGSITTLNRLASGLTDRFQTGTLSDYLMMILGALIVLVGYALFSGTGAIAVPLTFDSLPAYEVAAAVVMLIAIVAVATISSRLGAIAALGIVGFFMTLFFVIYSGPDLALTQLLVETLLVILLLLVFYFLPRSFVDRSSRLARWRDITIAVGVGTLVTILTMLAIFQQETPAGATSTVSEFYLQESVPSAFGANVVNVILVDFRALDTLGEMTVLVIAALGAYALIKLHVEDNQEPEDRP
jgi:multicomponent Na+:H+ antiporter subunit A